MKQHYRVADERNQHASLQTVAQSAGLDGPFQALLEAFEPLQPLVDQLRWMVQPMVSGLIDLTPNSSTDEHDSRELSRHTDV